MSTNLFRQLIARLRAEGSDDWADRLEGALDFGATSGEILTTLRWELRQLIEQHQSLGAEDRQDAVAGIEWINAAMPSGPDPGPQHPRQHVSRLPPIHTTSFYVGSYWRPRVESPDVCGSRAWTCLDRLGSISDVLNRWYPVDDADIVLRDGRVREPEDLKALLLGGRTRDVLGEIDEEYGFSATLWTADSSAPISARMTCGGSLPYMSHCFVVRLPGPLGRAEEWLDPDRATSVIRAIVAAWSPDWAIVTTPQLREGQPLARFKPNIGWMTYLSSRFAVPTPVRSDVVTVSPFEGGSLLVAGRTAADVTATLTREIYSELDSDGLLDPTQ